MSLFQFNVASLFVGSVSPYNGSFESLAAQTLEGVQSASFVASFPRTDAFSWDGNGTQEYVGRPRAELSFSYAWTASGINESNLGFALAPSGTIPALSTLNQERNYYLLAGQSYQDQIGDPSWNNQVFALGNGLITRYGLSAAVGQPTRCDVTVEGLNLLVQMSGSGQPLPAINKQSGTATTGLYTLPEAAQTTADYFEARPGSIVLSFNTGSAMGVLLSGNNACPVQAFSFTIDMPRAEVQDLGWAYPGNRPIQWPVSINIHADAHVNGFQLDALTRGLCPDTGYSFQVGFKNGCNSTDDLAFVFNGAKLNSESIGLQVGGGTATVSLDWSLKIMDIARLGVGNPNFYIYDTGVPYSSIVFPQVGYVSGVPPLTFGLSTPSFLLIMSGPAILSGNSVFVADDATSVVVRAAAADGSDTQDVTVSIS